KETSTKSGNRMAFFTLEDMDGTVDVTVFPEPYKAGAAGLHSREALLVRGRVDDGEKGRVVLADDIRPLEQALAETTGRHSVGAAEANACRIRVAAATAPEDLREPDGLAADAARPAPQAPPHARLHQAPLRGLRRAPRRPALRRRPGHRRRPRALRGARRRRHRPPEGA